MKPVSKQAPPPPCFPCPHLTPACPCPSLPLPYLPRLYHAPPCYFLLAVSWRGTGTGASLRHYGNAVECRCRDGRQGAQGRGTGRRGGGRRGGRGELGERLPGGPLDVACGPLSFAMTIGRGLAFFVPARFQVVDECEAGSLLVYMILCSSFIHLTFSFCLRK